MPIESICGNCGSPVALVGQLSLLFHYKQEKRIPENCPACGVRIDYAHSLEIEVENLLATEKRLFPIEVPA